MGLEIERKWLPAPGLINKITSRVKPVIIEQAYLCCEPVIRIRREEDAYYLTYKGKGYVCREEYNLPLTKKAYEELLPKRNGLIIKKKRYKLSVEELFPNLFTEVTGSQGSLLMELDVFEEDHKGLMILEVEFESEDSAREFEAPDCFGIDVTGQKEYTNSFLSLKKSKV